MAADFTSFLETCRERVDFALEQTLPVPQGPERRLLEAMRYSVFNGGKRVRPCLVYAAAGAFADPDATVDTVAAAVELVHAYSLIHDDLPAMDNDALRRGKPTCHIAFDEATAILAGDGLQTLAFELLGGLEDWSIAAEMVVTLARAIGPAGMVSGQAIDLAAVDSDLDELALEHMHHRKTGALIAACVSMGAKATGKANDEQITALHAYGRLIGLAFQVNDDILDVASATETLGKKQGADQALNKPTYVSLLGLKGAREKLERLHWEAQLALKALDSRADHLRAIADYIVKRDH